jgi:hypothetical protein
MVIIGGINTCTQHQERRTLALEKQAENTERHSTDVSNDVSGMYYCDLFLAKPHCDELITQALIARNFIEPMSAEEIRQFPADSLKKAVSEYQHQWMNYDVIDATGEIDCYTIEALGLTQVREVKDLEHLQLE